jgi:hypothetical protein
MEKADPLSERDCPRVRASPDEAAQRLSAVITVLQTVRSTVQGGKPA